jgi:hypothetical protein
MSHPSPSPDQAGRTRPYAWIVIYAALALGWAGFARWIVPPLLAAEPPGRLAAAVRRYLAVPPVLFLTQDPLGRWREVSEAVLIALALHLAIVGLLRRQDRRSAAERTAGEARAARRMSHVLALLAAAFLAVTALSRVFQDYYFYLEIWYHVRHGRDPWFIVYGQLGAVPLNAYGPLFNLLGLPAGINPLAPKLLFAFTYILFATSAIKGFLAAHPPSGLRALGLILLFWNPLPWVEIAYYGHFDVLVGLACLGAARARGAGRDIRSGACLAAGVLLKYLPIALLPFLAIDRGRRLRYRLLVAALVPIAAGLGLSTLIWGPSTFLPLKLAATRSSTMMSIFHFLRGRYSPLPRFGILPNLEDLAPCAQLLALGCAWMWARIREPDVEASAAVAAAITVLLYRVGYPQYQTVPFVLGSAWAVHRWDRLRGRILLALAMAGDFGWLAAFDVYYMLVDQWHLNSAWAQVQDLSGLPTFLLGCAFVAAVVRAAPPQVSALETGSRPCSNV